MRKYYLLLFVPLLLLTSCGTKNQEQNQKSTSSASDAMKQVDDTTAKKSQSSVESKAKSVGEQSQTELVEEKQPEVAEKFVSSFLNFDNLKERDEQIKRYLTEKAISSKGFGKAPDTAVKSKGEILDVYESKYKDSDFDYVVLAKVNANNETRYVMFEVKLDKSGKVSDFNYYVTQKEI